MLKKQSLIYFKLKSFDINNLNNFEKKIKYLNLQNKNLFLPLKIKRFVVLRSPHIDKKSREHFEKCTFTKLIIIKFNILNFNDIIKIKFLLLNVINSFIGTSIKIKFKIN